MRIFFQDARSRVFWEGVSTCFDFWGVLPLQRRTMMPERELHKSEYQQLGGPVVEIGDNMKVVLEDFAKRG